MVHFIVTWELDFSKFTAVASPQMAPKGWNFRVGKSAYPRQPRVQDSVWLTCLSSLNESCVLHLYQPLGMFFFNVIKRCQLQCDIIPGSEILLLR